MTEDNVNLQVVLGSAPFIADDGTRPDGRWLARDAAGRVTIIKRWKGRESFAFQPVTFADGVKLAHAVIDGDTKVITYPMTLAALAAVVAELALQLEAAATAEPPKDGA